MSRNLGLGVEDQFDYAHPSEIWQEMADNTPIIAGISYERLGTGRRHPVALPDT